MLVALALLLPLLPQDEPPSFAKDQRIVAALYHVGPDTRHAAEFLDLGKAGVDIAVVVLQGPIEGVDPLIAALDALEKENRSRPRLAVLIQPGKEPDLSAADAFYVRARRHAALIDGRPVVWLAARPSGALDEPAALAAAVSRLQRRPYLVAEVSWKGAPADRTWASGALRGFAIELPVVSVTPGAGSREEGKVYERFWFKAIKLEPRMVLIESWNGPADGVSETDERKRKYLDATARLVRDYRINEKPVLGKGKWTGATHVAWTIAYNPHDQGMRPVAVDDGVFEEVRLRGFEALSSKENRKGTIRRLCFDVDDSYCWFDRRSFEVAVEFFDIGEGSFSLEYDSGDRTLPAEQRVVKSAGAVRFSGSGEWRTELFKLPDAVFGNGQPGGSDFRLSVDKRGLSLRSVLVMKK